jgi:hypothetical protein
MKKAKPKPLDPKKITHLGGKTKMERKNEKALKLIRSIKGMFG